MSRPSKRWPKRCPTPRVVWVMVPSGKITDDVIHALAGVLSKGDLVIDGGNSRFTEDAVHAEFLAKKGIRFVDCGVSGGVWGLENGYGLMAGGDEQGHQGGPAGLRRPAPGWPARRGIRARRPDRRRPLREDGAQRHRVRDHAGLGRGLRDHGHPQGHREGRRRARSRRGSAAPSCARGCSSCWSRRSKRIRSSRTSRATSRIPAKGAGRSTRRWTSPCRFRRSARRSSRRFVSRQPDSPAMKAVAALRNQFGGHAVRKA